MCEHAFLCTCMHVTLSHSLFLTFSFPRPSLSRALSVSPSPTSAETEIKFALRSRCPAVLRHHSFPLASRLYSYFSLLSSSRSTLPFLVSAVALSANPPTVIFLPLYFSLTLFPSPSAIPYSLDASPFLHIRYTYVLVRCRSGFFLCI